ncbi:MAG: TnsA endonuclease N-terminal domain-containing protein [Brevundimonas sp.]
MEHFHHPFTVPERYGPTALDHAISAYAHDNGDALSWESLSATATLVTTPDGSPIRSIITGRRHVTTGSYASRKAGRGLPYESMPERALFMQSEVDTDVVDYRAQPFRFESVVDGKKRIYIADCVRLLSDGSIEVVEVKHDIGGLRDPDYAGKLQAVRLICERVGWRFRVMLQKPLRTSRGFEDIVDIQSWRFTDVSQSDIFCVASALDRNPMALGDLVDVLSQILPLGEGAARAVAMAKLKAMVVLRTVRFDLSKLLSLQTPVTLVNDQPEIQQ